MKRIYNIMGVSILSIAVLSSCQKDEFIGKVIGETTTYTMTAEINNSDSRATVNENMEFQWHAHDALSVNDNTNNFKFSTFNYFDEKQSNKAEFVGDAAFAEGTSEVTVIYPYKETEPTVLELPAEIEQTQDTPELKNTMFMAGTGTINGDKIENVTLKHLTALYQFKVKNNTGRMLNLKNISVEASGNIFPLKLTYGEPSTSDNNTNKLNVKFNDKEFADGSEVNAYMNIFPTGNIGSNTLTFKVVGTDEEDKERRYEALKGSVSSLYPSSFTGYTAGKRYIVNLEITGEKEAGPEEGYDVDTEGTYHIYNADGLMAWKDKVAIDNTTNAVLEKNIDMSGKDNWTPIEEYWGTFDGNNKKIQNLTIDKNEDSKSGLFLTNNGEIKNLILSDISLHSDGILEGGVVAHTNKGNIYNVHLTANNINYWGLQNSKIGGLVGTNDVNSTIEFCSAEGVTIKAKAGNVYLGGIASQNFGFIKACYSNVEVNLVNFAGRAAGITAFNRNTVLASYSIGKVQIEAGANINIWLGGLIGENGNNWNKNVKANGCYSTSEVIINSANPNPNGKHVGGLIAATYSVSEAAYTSYTGADPVGTNNIDGETAHGVIKLSSNSELCGTEVLNNLNSAIKDTGYMYEVNSGEDKGNRPLILKKISE